MQQVWQAFEFVRPDPYQDWAFEMRNRVQNNTASVLDQSGKNVDTWVAALVTVKGETKAEFKHNLEHLQYSLVADPREVLTGENSASAHRMFEPERARLNATIAELKRLADQDASILDLRHEPSEKNDTFGLYIPESRAFDENGSYKEYDSYRIEITGPPIFGFLDPDGRPERDAEDDGSNKRIDPEPEVILGIIDDGIGFAHESFLKCRETVEENGQQLTIGETRIRDIWIQGTEGANKDGVDVKAGVFLDNTKIDELLKDHSGDDLDIYRAKSLMPGTIPQNAASTHVPLARRLSHGTHVLDIAAGTDPDDNSAEARAMRNVPILAVQLPPEVTADTSGSNLTSYVLQGLHWMMLRAAQLAPQATLVVNFSYGIFAGPKDGSHFLEHWVEELMDLRQKALTGESASGEERQATYLVLPAGNHYLARATARAKLDQGKATKLDWVIQPDDATPSFLEIWIDGLDPANPTLGYSITAPNGAVCEGEGVPNQMKWVLHSSEESKAEVSSSPPNQPIAAAYAQWYPPESYDTDGKPRRLRVVIAANPTARNDQNAPLAPYGPWQITLRNTGETPIRADFFVQRDDTPIGYDTRARQSYLDHKDAYCWDSDYLSYTGLNDDPMTHRNSISAIATSRRGTILTVGAVTPTETASGVEASNFSAAGSIDDGNLINYSGISDLDPACPGVLAAGTLTGSTVAMSGTSVATPQVTRKLVLSLLGKGPLAEPNQPPNGLQNDRVGTVIDDCIPEINWKRLRRTPPQ